MSNKKKQKYINIILFLGIMLILYPFLGMYTLDATWDISFFSVLFTSKGIIYFGKYIIIGIILFGLGFTLDRKTNIKIKCLTQNLKYFI